MAIILYLSRAASYSDLSCIIELRAKMLFGSFGSIEIAYPK